MERAGKHERGKLLRDSSVRSLYRTPQPTTHINPPDVLDIVITNNLSFPVYLSSCSALSSDHLPVLIDAVCRSSFHHLPDRPDFRRNDSAKCQTHWRNQFHSVRNCTRRWQSTLSLRTSPPPLLRLCKHQLAHVKKHGLRFWPAFRTRCA